MDVGIRDLNAKKKRFEITDTPPFDTPVVGWNPDPEEDEPIR